MIEVIEAFDSDQNTWMEYANSISDMRLYHDYRWRDVLEKSFGHKCFYLMAQTDKKVSGIFPLVFIKGNVMPSSMVSLAFFNYGGILSDNKETAASLLKSAIGILKKEGGRYIEIRNTKKLDLALKTREHKVTMRLQLSDDIDQEWKKLDAKVRNQIRKAQKSDLVGKSGKEELLDKFYCVFSRNMRDLGTPVLGKIFFKNILRCFNEESRIFIVEQNSKIVAGAFTLCRNSVIEVPWASSIRIFNRLCPNEFMYWEIIRHAISNGLKQFDFGRCTKNTGAYRFKKQWNPEVKQLYWQYWASKESYLPTNNPQRSKFRFLITIWKRLPLLLANKLGPCVAKNIPIF